LKVDITFLGTGSAFSKKFGNNSAVVSVENEGITKNIMIDCGRTAPDDLANSEFSWNDIDAIFITHLHGDHVYGLEEAGFMGRYVVKKKPHLIFPHAKIKNDLWNKVLKGTMMVGDLDRVMSLDDYFTYEIVDDREQYFLFNDCMFSVYSTQHVENKKSYGLIIGEYDYIVYTSDSLFDKEFIEASFIGGAQAMFHDCQFVDYEGKVHASLNELETLSDKYKESITIMHYGDDLSEYYTRIKDSKFGIANRGTKYSYIVE
jgi:ribonuclease BN (tRNA processing enzyme)